ncbi:MAG: OB-fold-containig protein [Caldimonas sp.]
MDVASFLTDPAVAPFSGALAVILAFFVFELLLTVLAGAGLSHLLGSLGETHWAANGSVVNWLLLKEVPLMMVIVATIGGFGLAGTGFQGIAQLATGHLLPLTDASIFATLCAVVSIRGFGMLFRKMMLVSTTALEPSEFIGNVAEVTSPVARVGYAASAKFTDRHGYVHLLMVEPGSADDVFVAGDHVVLCEQASASLFKARKA